ncbi:MAG: hypothetical protein L0332_31760, partial [Chloroflexi bacterium]|nr:hypothetical protein [Chloroflexota bacterium]MCI0731278.1 hypothetical protein [Chloroflexota bacterium]
LSSSNDVRANDVLTLLKSTRNLIEGWIASYGFTDINTTYASKIDQEINRHLWLALTEMGWKLDGTSLSAKQRAKSGVSHVKYYLHETRARLSDQELWRAYWTTEENSK